VARKLASKAHLSDCTIIIPTYNRPQYLNRILDYFDSFDDCYDIIVVDSSYDSNKALNKELVSSHKRARITYLSSYSPDTYFYDKLLDSLRHVKTKYCVMCADDDFIVPNGISQAVDFLDKNEEFIVAHGHYMSFWLEKDSSGASKFYYSLPYPFSPSVQPIRLRKAKAFYGVYRTPVFRMFVKEIAENIDNLVFAEIMYYSLTSLYGKEKQLDVLYYAREYMAKDIRFRYETLGDIIERGAYDEKYRRYKQCLSRHVMKTLGVTPSEASRLIDEFIDTWKEQTFTHPKQRMLRAISAVLRKAGVYNTARFFYRRALLGGSDASQFLAKLEDKNSKYYSDFYRIKSYVLTHNIAIINAPAKASKRAS